MLNSQRHFEGPEYSSFLERVQPSPEVRLAPCAKCTGAPSPKAKRAGRKADNSSTSSAEVRNENGLSYSFRALQSISYINKLPTKLTQIFIDIFKISIKQMSSYIFRNLEVHQPPSHTSVLAASYTLCKSLPFCFAYVTFLHGILLYTAGSSTRYTRDQVPIT